VTIPVATLEILADGFLTDVARLEIGGDHFSPLVFRVTDSAYDNGDSDAAVFIQAAHGHPWVMSKAEVLASNKIWRSGDTAVDSIPTDTTVIYPDYDYSTFE